MSRVLVRLLVALFLLGACAPQESPPATAPKASPSPKPSPSPSPSVVINPPGLIVENHALGASTRRIRRAMRDLKAINLWRPLTKHLYKAKFQTRLGAVSVPDDGHLADAILTAGFGKRAQGLVCDVMFFPNAIARDLDRWRLYYSQGSVVEVPPTLRQLWGAVTAHELGHCLPGGPGEKVAQKWERKALAKLQELSG